MGVFETLCYDDETDCITIDCPTNYGYEGKTDEERIRAFIKERISDTVSVDFRKVTLFMFSSPIVAESPSGYGTMSIVHIRNKIIALICDHEVRGYTNVGAKTHPYSGCLIPAFCQVHKTYRKIDVAFVLVHHEQHHAVNSVYFNFVFYDFVFEQFNVTLKHLRDIFMHMKVFKVGVKTGLTEDIIEFVDKNLLMVRGDKETAFSEPGDSGSLVFIKHEGRNIVVGMVARGSATHW